MSGSVKGLATMSVPPLLTLTAYDLANLNEIIEGLDQKANGENLCSTLLTVVAELEMSTGELLPIVIVIGNDTGEDHPVDTQPKVHLFAPIPKEDRS